MGKRKKSRTLFEIKCPMEKINIDYDKDRDVLYVISGKPKETLNVTLDNDTVVRLNNRANEIVGITVTNFSYVFPKLVKRSAGKSKWFVEEFFSMFLTEFNHFMKTLVAKNATNHLLSSSKVNKKQLSLLKT